MGNDSRRDAEEEEKEEQEDGEDAGYWMLDGGSCFILFICAYPCNLWLKIENKLASYSVTVLKFYSKALCYRKNARTRINRSLLADMGMASR